ncbi:uncharacterized protein EDB91DRAFT_1277846 [Suillus paluster]|uniref:uncharacterized protein n=1 Tax=Suillus paluster TaxID=48578 RepID=UPI001B86EDAD|nr:uncharacterized protein EDB91DRAFT_1277846 [Suillus paluster]KAG1755265.1 hypothetical protein EDB91DRAFT_1277846 [Suillus paluster]
MLTLALNLIVTLCTESIGFMHSISLRSALASESRLIFSTNLRLITAARGWCNPNGAVLNGLMAVLLTISYSSASLTIFPLHEAGAIMISGFPLLVLGIGLFLQVAITLAGMLSVKILTWSSSPFDVTAAMLHHTQLTPASFRCMRGVSDLGVAEGPTKPSEAQPSAWNAHTSIRKIVLSLWGLVVACAGWAVFVKYKHNYIPKNPSWSFFDKGNSYAFTQNIMPVDQIMSAQLWILSFVDIAVVQGPLTLGLHCSDLIANVIQNERQWRCATTKKGLRTSTNPLKALFTNPLGLGLFVVKPVLHWMFGLAFSLRFWMDTLPGIDVINFCADMRILNLCIALLIFACVFTFAALRPSHGPQPAAYGHLQTLANLVDEWSDEMWWGHKEDGVPYCHAGTSNHPLPDVKMECVYAGSGVMSHPAIPGEESNLEK